MPPIKFKSILALEENPADVFKSSVELLIRIARNILNDPSNPKFRSISLGSSVVTNKLLPVSGAMECLFEMGFQEGEDKLILPQKSSLEALKIIYDELLKRKDQPRVVANELKQTSKIKKSVENSITTLLVKDLTELTKQTSDPFLKKVIVWCFYVLKYENISLQEKALKLVPLTEMNLNVMKCIRQLQLELKKKNIHDENINYQELLLRELCNWFNKEFFTWVDTPRCTNCGFVDTVYIGVSTERVPEADRIEEYSCTKCKAKVLFPRYTDPDTLLKTRKGRCGEWANCFCLFCRAMGWDARLVFDETDHVWVEVYSILNSRWIHCDPCENAVDTPLMYEHGWKKKLSYVIAYSKDDIQDVTWRYSSNHSEVLKNRNKCSEEVLVDFIIKLRNLLLGRASSARRNFVIKRTVLELVELMKENPVSENDEKGRISGSLAWRLLRGEVGEDLDFKSFTWKVDSEDEKIKKFVLSYITSKDEYFKHSKSVQKNWKSGLFNVKSVFKKDENDWKMCYLARTVGSDQGSLSWRFETGDKYSIGTIELKLVTETFETGVVSSKLCSGTSCVLVPNDKGVFFTDAFRGCKAVELTVELSGGNSWQHAQVLRQSMASDTSTFSIVINLAEC